MISSLNDKEIDNPNNIDIENISLEDQKNLRDDLYIFQKLKNTISDLQSETSQLRQELYQLKENNNNLLTEKQSLLNIIKEYKSKENLFLLTKESLNKLNEDYDSLKSAFLSERNKFQLELRIKESIYDRDVIQTNMRTENIKNQMDVFSNIKKLNDILYIKNNELKKNIELIQLEEKAKLEDMEIKYTKKMDNYKKKMIDFLKKNEQERLKLGTQTELNNKLNILHIQELINELEIQGVEVEDLLKERQELKMKIMSLNHDLLIYQEIIDTMTKKNHKFQNKLKKISNNIKEYNLTKKDKGEHLVLTEPNDKSLNLLKMKKRKNLSTNNKEEFKLIKNKKAINNNYIRGVSSKYSIPPFSIRDYNAKLAKQKNKDIKIKIKIDDNENIDNKTQNNTNCTENFDKKKKNDLETLLKEKEKYKDLYEYYKEKFDSIQNKYSYIFKMYNEILEKIYKEEIVKKNKENIFIDLNEFKEMKFQNMTSEQKYAILIKLINNIAPILYKKDIENNLFLQNVSKVKEKYTFNGLNSFNLSSQNSTKISFGHGGISNIKMKAQNINDSFRTTTTTFYGGGVKCNKSINSFDDYKKIFCKKKDQRTKSSLHFGNSKIDVDLFPKVNILE